VRKLQTQRSLVIVVKEGRHALQAVFLQPVALPIGVIIVAVIVVLIVVFTDSITIVVGPLL
jgi:hypothetical protein